MTRFARSLFLIIFLLTALAPAAAAAQPATRLESLEVALWPEYDRPQVLVIYLARASAGLKAPLTFELPIPAAVGEPHAVAAWYPDGQLDDQIEWSRTVDGVWATISAEVETTGLWIEYYAPFEVDGTRTSFPYQWPGGVDITSFSYEVMHPVGSQDVNVEPTGETELDDDGMRYTRSQLGAAGVDRALSIEVSYDQPSRPKLEPAAPYPSNPGLDNLEIRLWPEYDEPEALVVMQAAVDSALTLPARVALPVPSAVGDPYAVAQQDAEGQLFVVPYERELIGDWAWIVVETELPIFQVEYYLPLTRQGRERSFTFYWPGGVEVGQLSYEVQHPVGAEAVRVLPPGGTALDDDGLFYTRANLGPREVGEGALISFDYSKADDVLTVESPPPSIDRPETTTGGTPDLTAQLPLVLAIFGAVLVLAGILLYLRFRSEDQPAPRRRRRTKRGTQAASGQREIEASPVYCHVCGAQADASDRFCRRCGTELRS
jgi:hypothetical protein